MHNISTDAIILLVISKKMIKHEAGLNNFFVYQTIDLFDNKQSNVNLRNKGSDCISTQKSMHTACHVKGTM